ncbi:hypothetical protein [Providencia heimbachae]|uniref:Oxygen-regulated invasion protein n=1 Tax=Providencia heimbachae ATCC 35613 TaxID=1354272 RepID=A0A1B7JTY0_9GAMM|nr:hypothetical protein [Providencia heimbachae]OAT51363.1 hypothetical protein M998_2300 [Providencia heimbachae ATCC 35613]QCJ68527.1 hypothetical protein C9446_00770 [Providencia heimbachae]SQH11527.1 Uncharacterised protein [Providencia heimbachae]
MTQLNKLLIHQSNIFLAPGHYFHREFNHALYHELPPLLQKEHNQWLIQQYSLTLPNERTCLLPTVLSNHWLDLPKIALGLGVILHPTPLPWWGELSQYRILHTRLGQSFWQLDSLPLVTPQTLLALGMDQLLLCLSPFGDIYTHRAKYMFSNAIQTLARPSIKTMLPWNIIEETCHYVRENTTQYQADFI